MSQHGAEVSAGNRFRFGANWSRFLKLLDAVRITQAERSLQEMLGMSDLSAQRFLDIGSGSGLFSLAARRLGAEVYSFDYDPQSVACTQELKRRFFPDDAHWRVEEGSALDAGYIRSLGQFDIVYSWGVLHHTGAMWQALANADLPVAPGGRLFISIYNDQGFWSRQWLRIKRLYNLLPGFLKAPYALVVAAGTEAVPFLAHLLTLHMGEYLRGLVGGSGRGMSRWVGYLDWIGGYPFEVAKPEQIFEFYKQRGYVLERLETMAGGFGCNQFIFAKAAVKAQ